MKHLIFLHFILFYIFSFSQEKLDSIALNSNSKYSCETIDYKGIKVDKKENYNYFKENKYKNHIEDEQLSSDSLYVKSKNRYSTNDFDYTEITEKERFTWYHQMLQRFNDWLNSLLGTSTSLNTDFLYPFLIFIFILIIGFIIYKLVISGRKGYKRNDEDEEVSSMEFFEKNLHKIDFSTYLEDAILKENYRLAIRFLHLRNLKLLSEKNIIEWEVRKTNLDFYNEIKDNDLKKLFHHTYWIYDYVWFGNFPINKTQFETYQHDFLTLKNWFSK